jgi:acetyltransferase-like isoleucine patch superfamily enzyme
VTKIIQNQSLYQNCIMMKLVIKNIIIKAKLFNLAIATYKLAKIGIIRRRWLRLNRHNFTGAVNGFNDVLFPIEKVVVGKYTYGSLHVLSYGTEGELLKIGCYCSIGSGVKFVLGGIHRRDTMTTYPFRHIFNSGQIEAQTKGPIILEDDVWIGTNALILSGVRLGKGTVVAAGSVVTKSTKPYSVVGGNPAILIAMRFEDSLISQLMQIDLEKIDNKWVLENMDKVCKPLNEVVLEDIKSCLKKNAI